MSDSAAPKISRKDLLEEMDRLRQKVRDQKFRIDGLVLTLAKQAHDNEVQNCTTPKKSVKREVESSSKPPPPPSKKQKPASADDDAGDKKTKRGKNAFFFYADKHRKDLEGMVNDEGNKATHGEKQRELGKRWKQLTDWEKKPFERLAQEAKEEAEAGSD